MSETPTTAPQGQPSGKKSNAWVWIVVAIVAVLVVLGIIGSLAFGYFAKKVTKKVVDTAVSTATNGAVDVSDIDSNGTITIEGDNGETTTIGTKLPDNFPSDIPIYPGATVRSASAGQDADGNPHNVAILTTSDNQATVEAYYDTELTKNGWAKNDNGINLGTIKTDGRNKGDRGLLVTFTPYQSDGLVMISIAEQSQ